MFLKYIYWNLSQLHQFYIFFNEQMFFHEQVESKLFFKMDNLTLSLHVLSCTVQASQGACSELGHPQWEPEKSREGRNLLVEGSWWR